MHHPMELPDVTAPGVRQDRILNRESLSYWLHFIVTVLAKYGALILKWYIGHDIVILEWITYEQWN